MSAQNTCSVESVGRQVIERKLLTALEDEGTVAALLSKQDLEDLIAALGCDAVFGPRRTRCQQLKADLLQLLNAAFPNKS